MNASSPGVISIEVRIFLPSWGFEYAFDTGTAGLDANDNLDSQCESRRVERLSPLGIVRFTIIAIDKLEMKRLLDESGRTFHVGSTACHRIVFVKL